MSSSIPVFRKGAWIHYPQPSPTEPLWSTEQTLQAASFYATALSQGHSPTDSSVYAEAYVNKQVYPGIQYNRSLEIMLRQIMDRAETA